ncbi:MAG: hypothetical protein ABSE99_02310 [Terracidiphilus sp.]|jgi:hypothetical protein
MTTSQGLYRELSYCALAHQDSSFIHQHVVDAYAAQNADDTAKPFSLRQAARESR